MHPKGSEAHRAGRRPNPSLLAKSPKHLVKFKENNFVGLFVGCLAVGCASAKQS
jgi:hypothetical protein